MNEEKPANNEPKKQNIVEDADKECAAIVKKFEETKPGERPKKFEASCKQHLYKNIGKVQKIYRISVLVDAEI